MISDYKISNYGMFRIVANHKRNKNYYSIRNKKYCSILQRTMITGIPENTDITIDDKVVSFDKKEYMNMVVEKRAAFMVKHFPDALKEAFNDLKKMASKMLPCEYTFCLTIKEHFDCLKIQSIVVAYFKDLGYEVTILDILTTTDICVILK